MSRTTSHTSHLRRHRGDNNVLVAGIDRVIHGRSRLAILSALSVHSKLTFPKLKAILRTTDGNIAMHTRKLEDAKYIVSSKYFRHGKPITEYSLTAAGRRAFKRYMNQMEELIHALRRQALRRQRA